MPELRKDYILDRWVIIATERAKRPQEFKKEVRKYKENVCTFCPGNEASTPEERAVLKKNGKWKIRVFLNKYPAVKLAGDFHIKTHNIFYTFADAYGVHEVLVETPDHSKQIWDLSTEDLQEIFKMYLVRIKALSAQVGISYVQVFKNHEEAAGTSIHHTHSQIIAYDTIPSLVRDELQAVSKYPSCPYCSIVQSEKNSYRRCFENETCIAFTPYASRFPFEILLLPKKHTTTLDQLENLSDFVDILKKVLNKLKELNAPFNYVLHYAPTGTNLHIHLEILPRLTIWAGFEYSGTIINPLPPEDAAKFYREEQ